jgi:hypothetical protein
LGTAGGGVAQREYVCWFGGGVGARDGDNICSGEAIVSLMVSSGSSAEVPSLALLSRRRYSLVAMNSHVEVLSTFFK